MICTSYVYRVYKTCNDRMEKSRTDTGGNSAERFDWEVIQLIWNFNCKKYYSMCGKRLGKGLSSCKAESKMAQFMKGL